MIATLLAFAAEGEEVSGAGLLLPAFYDILWSAVVLIPMAWVVYTRLVPTLNSILDARAAKIEGGIKHAEQVQARADAALAEYEAKAMAGREEAVRIRDAARADGERIIAEARAKASEEAARILATAHQQIAADRAAAKNALTKDVGDIATALAGKIVGEQLSDEAAQSRMIDRFLDELERA